MENWTNEIIKHLEARNELVKEITQEVSFAVDEITAALSGDLESLKRSVDAKIPRFDEEKRWTVKVGDCDISFDINDVERNRQSQNEEGFMLYDESIPVGDAVRKIMKNKIIGN